MGEFQSSLVATTRSLRSTFAPLSQVTYSVASRNSAGALRVVRRLTASAVAGLAQTQWSSAAAGGVRLEIEAAPLAGRQASQMPTTLVDFVLDADLAFLA